MPSGRFTREALTRSFASLTIREYRRWSLAQMLSGTGAATSQIAIAWFVVELGGNGVVLGLTMGCMMLPTLLLGSFMGTLVDRYSRRSLLLVTASVQMVIMAVLAALALSGALVLWMLVILSLLHGIAFAADNPARQLLVMDLVGRERITSAVSMNEIIINGSRVLGPGVAGILLVTTSTAWCFIVSAVAFVPAIVVLLWLRATGAGHTAVGPTSRHTDPLRASSGQTSLSAWRFVVATPPVWATLLLAVCAAACYNIAVVVPLIVADVFHADGGAYGALALAFGLGALPGAFFSATGPTMPLSKEVRALAAAAAAAVLLSAAAPALPLLFFGLVGTGGAVMWFIARANAFVMLTVPTEIRGRVMGIWTMALPGSTVVTGVIVGVLADLTDPRIAYGIVGLVTAVTVGICWRAFRSQPQQA